jgi:hypothetical protein
MWMPLPNALREWGIVSKPTMICFRYEGGKKCAMRNSADEFILAPFRRRYITQTASQQASLGVPRP